MTGSVTYTARTPSSTPTAWRSTACSTGAGRSPPPRCRGRSPSPAGGTTWTGGPAWSRPLSGSQAQVISIEHEDPFVPADDRRAGGRAAAAGRHRRRQDGAGVTVGTDRQPARRLRVGLVGTGLIAQVMHLHYLAELADRFEVAAVCDIDGRQRRGVRRAVPHPRRLHRLAGTAPASARRGPGADLGQPRADRGGGGAGRAARVRGEADVLLGRRGTGDGGRGRAGRGDPDGRLPEALRPGLRALPAGGRRLDRRPAAAGDHVRVAAAALRRALPAAPAGAAARRASRSGSARTPTRGSGRRSARPPPSWSGRSTRWCCWTRWCTS